MEKSSGIVLKHDFKYDGLMVSYPRKVKYFGTHLDIFNLTSGRIAISYNIYLGAIFRQKILSWINPSSDSVRGFSCL